MEYSHERFSAEKLMKRVLKIEIHLGKHFLTSIFVVFLHFQGRKMGEDSAGGDQVPEVDDEQPHRAEADVRDEGLGDDPGQVHRPKHAGGDAGVREARRSPLHRQQGRLRPRPRGHHHVCRDAGEGGPEIRPHSQRYVTLIVFTPKNFLFEEKEREFFCGWRLQR